MAKRTHRVIQHRSGIAGVEAMTMFTEHAFPRHSHDHFGIGIMTSGAQRSWSLIGNVESEAGDVIMLNPGEMHDGSPVGGMRSWRIIYIDPALVAREIANDSVKGEPLIRPVARDPHLAAHVAQVSNNWKIWLRTTCSRSRACCSVSCMLCRNMDLIGRARFVHHPRSQGPSAG